MKQRLYMPHELRKMYEKKNMTIAEISRETEIPESTVRRRLIFAGANLRSRKRRKVASNDEV